MYFGVATVGIQVTRRTYKSDILIEVKLKYGETVGVEWAFQLIGLRRPNSVLYPHSGCVVGVCWASRQNQISHDFLKLLETVVAEWFGHWVVSDSLWPHGLYPTGSSVRGIFQARTLECIAFSCSRLLAHLPVSCPPIFILAAFPV